MSKYGKILASEVAQRQKNIAVITPVNEYIMSPINGIEPIIQKAFQMTQNGSGDVGTYAQFKDALIRATCEDHRYYPRLAIKNTAAVQASADLHEFGTLEGLDPQFYESIDPSLPLVLTHSGLSKYRNNTLALSPRKTPSTNVEVSPETQASCSKQQNSLKAVYEMREQERLYNLNELSACEKNQSRPDCIEKIRLRRSPPETSGQ